MMMTFLYEFLGPLFVVMSTKQKNIQDLHNCNWLSARLFALKIRFPIEVLKKKMRKTFMLTQAEIVEKPKKKGQNKKEKKKKKKYQSTINITSPQSILFRFALDMDICIKQTLVSPWQVK